MVEKRKTNQRNGMVMYLGESQPDEKEMSEIDGFDTR